MQAANFPYGPAIVDLDPNNQNNALQMLGQTPIPCFAEVGDSVGDEFFSVDTAELEALNGVLVWLDSQPEDSLFLDDQGRVERNDRVVSVTSQEGGLLYDYKITLGANHRTEKSSNDIGADVTRLLSGPITNLYKDGFPQPPAAKNLRKKSLLYHAHDGAEPQTSFVTITNTTDGETYTPLDGQVFQPGDFLDINIIPNVGTTLSFAWIIAGAKQQNFGSSLVNPSPFSDSDSYFSVPQSYLGDLPITVLAQDTSGNVCLVTAHASVQTSAVLLSLTASPSNITVSSQGNTVGLTATGTFTDGVDRDVTAASFGTTYISGNPAVATVDTNGLVTAVENGNTQISVANGTVKCVTNVTVNFGTPEIINITPASANRNTTSQVSLIGSNLGGTSQLDFLLNDQIDPNITASNIAVSDQGTTLTAIVNVAANAAPGNRTIVVTTPGGQSDMLAAPDAAGFVVNPDPTLASLTLPSAVPGGTVVTATVTLSGITPTDVVVGLSSSDSATVRVYQAVIVPAGSSSATFVINTYRSHTTKTVKIQASLGQVVMTAPLTISGR